MEDGGVLFREVDRLGLGLLEIAAEGLLKVLGLEEDVLVDLHWPSA